MLLISIKYFGAYDSKRCTRAYRNSIVICKCINVYPTTVYYGVVKKFSLSIKLIEVYVH